MPLTGAGAAGAAGAAGGRTVVVGAGITGLAVARELARRGRAVTVLDTSPPGAPVAASGRSLAWLNAFSTEHEDYHRFRVEGLALYRDLALDAAAGRFVHLDGALWWPDREGLDAWPTRRERLQQLGFPVEELTPRQVAARFPEVDASRIEAGLAVLAPTEGWVDLPGLMGVLAAEITSRGGQVVAAPAPVRVLVEGGHGGAVVGVETGRGIALAADDVVVAAGPLTPEVVRESADLQVPVHEEHCLLVRSRPFAGAGRLVLNTPGVSLRPEPDGGVAFDTGWAEGTVTPTDDGFVADEDAVHAVVENARAVLTAGSALEVDRLDLGVKPVPGGDGLPVVGPVPGVRGLFMAYTHSGATNALVLARDLSQAVVGEADVPAFLDPARLA